MTIFLMLYIIYFIATVLVKGTVVGIWYRRKDFLYYNFLSNIITSSVFSIMFWAGMIMIGMIQNDMVERMYGSNLRKILFLMTEVVIFVIETIIYKKIFTFYSKRAITTSILTNIITIILYVTILTVICRLSLQ